MTRHSIETRLSALEAVKEDLLTLLCTDEKEQERLLTVDEYERLQHSAITFEKVLSGCNLTDLDRLLAILIPETV